MEERFVEKEAAVAALFYEATERGEGRAREQKSACASDLSDPGGVLVLFRVDESDDPGDYKLIRFLPRCSKAGTWTIQDSACLLACRR